MLLHTKSYFCIVDDCRQCKYMFHTGIDPVTHSAVFCRLATASTVLSIIIKSLLISVLVFNILYKLLSDLRNTSRRFFMLSSLEASVGLINVNWQSLVSLKVIKESLPN